MKCFKFPEVTFHFSWQTKRYFWQEHFEIYYEKTKKKYQSTQPVKRPLQNHATTLQNHTLNTDANWTFFFSSSRTLYPHLRLRSAVILLTLASDYTKCFFSLSVCCFSEPISTCGRRCFRSVNFKYIHCVFLIKVHILYNDEHKRMLIKHNFLRLVSVKWQTYLKCNIHFHKDGDENRDTKQTYLWYLI